MDDKYWIIFLVILVIIILVSIGLILYYYYINLETTSNSTNALTTFPRNPTVWSDLGPSRNINKNTCQLYTFPTTNVGGANYYTGIPTLNVNQLDFLVGESNFPSCLDPDQIMAIEHIQECTSPVEGLTGTYCLNSSGQQESIGATGLYYVTCGSLSKCTDQLGVVNIGNSGVSGSTIYCANTNVLFPVCDISDPQQVAKISRATYDSKTDTMSTLDSGYLAKIYLRDDVKYLLQFDPTSVEIFYNCGTSNKQPVSIAISVNPVLFSTDVPQVTNNTPSTKGYYWMIIPNYSLFSTQLQKNVSFPQRLINITNLNNEDLETLITYLNKSQFDFLSSYLILNNIGSIMVNANGTTPVGNYLYITETAYQQCYDASQEDNAIEFNSVSFATQFLTYQLYNIQQSLAACSPSNTTNCVSF